MSQAGVPDPNVRASDADRERIVEQLRQHTADGRLTMDEFEERMAAAYAAKTYRDLAELTRDLPVDLGAAGGRPYAVSEKYAAREHDNQSEFVNVLIGAAMDWKMQKQQFRDQMREQRHQAKLAKQAAQPIGARFAGWAAISTLLTGIWFMAGITSGGHFGHFWPIWPIGILGFFTVLGALKHAALRRELTRR